MLKGHHLLCRLVFRLYLCLLYSLFQKHTKVVSLALQWADAVLHKGRWISFVEFFNSGKDAALFLGERSRNIEVGQRIMGVLKVKLVCFDAKTDLSIGIVLNFQFFKYILNVVFTKPYLIQLSKSLQSLHIGQVYTLEFRLNWGKLRRK